MSSRLRRVARGAMLLVLVLGMVGCQRGCLSDWLRRAGVGPVATESLGGGGAGGEGAICPGGLTRCQGGVVSASRPYRPPARCSPEGCRCPWDEVARCPLGCVREGYEVEMGDAARVQLCVAAPGAPVLADALPPGTSADAAVESAEAEAFDPPCEIERYRCAGSVVFACDEPPVAVARCRRGCAGSAAGPVVLVEDLPLEQALAIVCER